MITKSGCNQSDELDFFIRHQEMFYLLFPDKYVAIRDKHVVAMGDDLEELEDNASRKGYGIGDYQAQLCGKDSSCYTVKIRMYGYR